jgi:transposase-like protein
VSRICAELDVAVAAFRNRSLAEQPFRYVFLDATYCKARIDHRVVSQAVVVATGVAADGRREVLGFDVGDSEDGAFWTAFLRSLKTRGLHGVQLVISDAHAGLKAAIQAVLLGAAWQRCRVHFLRNVLAQVPKGHAEMVAAAIRTVFAQPDAEHVRYRRAIKARGHFPNEASALKCLYLVTRSLDPTGGGRARWAMRWKPALNAFAITFAGRLDRAIHKNRRTSHTVGRTDPP